MYFNVETLYKFLEKIAILSKSNIVINYVKNISLLDIQHSIILTSEIYIASLFIYWIFIYKFWVPKWEAKRKENEHEYTRTHQRVAQNLKDEFMGN
jgi:hypothetical protein